MRNVLCLAKNVLAIRQLSQVTPKVLVSSHQFVKGISTDNFANGKNENNSLHQVTIVGGGHMGTGIAQVSAAAGNIVTVADSREDALRNSKAKTEERLLKTNKKLLKGGGNPEELTSHMQAVMNRITYTTDIEKSVEKCDLVVEAITEEIDAKQKLFSILDDAAPPSTIFVTNTSSILVGEIGERLSAKRKERLGGVHFFHAVVMKLVEVIRIPETSDESFVKIMNWTKFIGKVPVTCKDTPGFIANRLNIPLYLEAIALYERGDANPRDIDTAMKLGAGFVYGPFEIMDFVGLDVIYNIMKGWEKRFPGHHLFKCPEVISQKYMEGKWGLKTGEGFFKYPMNSK